MTPTRLENDEVHLWSHSLEASAVSVEILRAVLSPDECARAARFRFEVHRRRYIAARARLRQILSTYLDSDPARICFTYNSFGKPAVDGDLRFNVSHSDDVAVYAFATRREIGVDVERIQSRFAEERIPEMFFSSEEVRTLRALPRDLQTEAFFLCWTRKEAYIKARAEGMSIPLDSFDVTLRPGDPPRFLRNGDGWSIETFRIMPDYAGAIVAAGEGWTWRIIESGGLTILRD